MLLDSILLSQQQAENPLNIGRLFNFEFDGNLTDLMGNYTPVVIGTASYVSTPTGQGANFSTAGLNRIDVPHDSNFDLASWSINLAIRFDADTPNFAVLLEKRSGSVDHWGLNFWSNQRFYVSVDDSNFFTNTAALNVTKDGTTWYHAVATYDNATNLLSFYLGGVLVASQTITAPTLNFEAYDVTIGQRKNTLGEQFDGTIDEASLWNKVLTADEVSNLYTEYTNKIN